MKWVLHWCCDHGVELVTFTSPKVSGADLQYPAEEPLLSALIRFTQ